LHTGHRRAERYTGSHVRHATQRTTAFGKRIADRASPTRRIAESAHPDRPKRRFSCYRAWKMVEVGNKQAFVEIAMIRSPRRPWRYG
jgi:hypothetical protein